MASFAKSLAPGTKQHTHLDVDQTRFLYRPLGSELFLVLLTPIESNILQDLNTLQLFASTVSERVDHISVQNVERAIFELLFAFDEVVSFGGEREVIQLSGVRACTAMESNEEIRQQFLEKVPKPMQYTR